MTKKTTTKITPEKDRTTPHWKELNKVIDPETGIGVVDMGLIYKIDIKKGKAKITMTLTSPACPVGPMIVRQIQDCLLRMKGIEDAETEIVWDPFWTQEMINPDIREMMFGL